MATLIYDKSTEQINFLDDRFYLCEGQYLPSVTTILEVYPKGFGFNEWLKNVGGNAQKIVDEAGAFGSEVHRLTELLNKGVEIRWTDDNGKAIYDLEIWQALLKFKEFWTNTKPELLANEMSIASAELGFGGTLDRVVKIAGKIWLLDIKTSNYIHKSHELQLAAYATMWNHLYPSTPIEDTGVIWLKANTRTDKIDIEKEIFQGKGWQIVKFPRHYTEAYRIFEHTHSIWKEENPNAQPKNLIYPDKISL